jgi:uroporphyrinogen III methyltransferase/synthase
MSKGIVYLVGAGPGDPGLLTLRGAELLASADVVVYDALANPRLLAHCPRAENVFVGKRAASHSMSQEQINSLLVELGNKGKRVVRLKGGDPFVFGRGGEECEALYNAGIPFEVVPGITAAIAAPAYAGIPVTHRDFNSSFTFLTGHEKEEEYRDTEAKQRKLGAGTDMDWAAIARLPCLAFYMGVKSLPRICQKLIEHGMAPDTPAATIQWGTTPKQRTVVGTLNNLPERIAEAKITAPAMTIIGRVVSLRDTMNWFETRPLFGKTVVVTRAREQASELSTRLEALGARVIEAPAVELVPSQNPAEIDEALRSLAANPVDWIVFTSANGVKFAKQRIFELGLDIRIFGNAKLAAIGDVTATAIREQLGLRVDLCPDSFVAEALAEELVRRNEVTGKKFLMLRADIARPLLRERLVEGGATVRDLSIYETRPILTLPAELRDALEADTVDWITFTSSSTAKNLIAMLGENYQAQLQNIDIASIGPITTATLKQFGLEPTLEAKTFNLDGLIESLITFSGGPEDRAANSETR